MTCLNLDDEIVLKIEKLVHEGFGLAHFDGIAIFVDNVCPDDVVKCKITNISKTYAKAKPVEILDSSSKRVVPFCKLSNVCGGCQWQHVAYEEQLVQKRNIVSETIAKIAGIDIDVLPVLPSVSTNHFRQKIQLPVQQTKKSKRFLAGYYKKNSHELVNIKHCEIQPDYFDEIIQFIRDTAQKTGITAYNEKTHKGILRHIVFRNSTTENKSVVIFVVNTNKVTTEMNSFAKEVFEYSENICGVVFNFNTKKNNVILSEKFENFLGDDFVLQKLGNITFKISAGSFFQVNPYSAQKIFDCVKQFVADNTKNPLILDAYCGVASFGIWVSDVAEEVWAVEQSHSSVGDAKDNLSLNGIKNVKLYEGDVKNIFDEFIRQKQFFDVVITDPPRKGCDEKALKQICDLTKKYLIYVSCNPATLARDLKYLTNNGFKVKSLQPVDMFCHTFHIESIVFMEKNQCNEN